MPKESEMDPLSDSTNIDHIWDEYKSFVASRTKQLHDHILNLHHAATGVAGEAGELLDITKKLWVYEQPIDFEKLRHLQEELGDLMFYLTMMLNHLDWPLSNILQSNMDKLTQRYPEGYSNEHAARRMDKESGE